MNLCLFYGFYYRIKVMLQNLKKLPTTTYFETDITYTFSHCIKNNGTLRSILDNYVLPFVS